MGDLNLRRLRYFLTLADELNYGRAAELLHVAQPALSRSISALERELGVRLFVRSRAGTRLAPAGELLRDEARALLHAADVLQQRLRLADREGRRVTIGFMPGMVLTPVVRHLEERFPGLRVEVCRASWHEQITALREGRFDAVYAQRPFDEDGLTVVDLYAEPRVVALPAGHPLATPGGVRLADLAGEELLQPAEAVPEWIFPSFSGPSSLSVEEKFENVAAGRGVVIVPESVTRYYRRPDLAFVPVTDLPDAEFCLVVEARRRSAVLRELLAFSTHADPASVGT
ncbi:LysR family transcriptional regulator [Catenuloplanes sp. NPDC051500]|uniref:LysR family transcriptional regulator n=1 Tax=Catenuloplanes sp. NPDC051500 TaxID=3363959 RepID=UPI0037945D76